MRNGLEGPELLSVCVSIMSKSLADSPPSSNENAETSSREGAESSVLNGDMQAETALWEKGKKLHIHRSTLASLSISTSSVETKS